MYCLPVASYWFEEETHTNLMVQTMLAAIVQDLNQLATVGLLVDGKVPWRRLMYTCLFSLISSWARTP